MRFFAILITKMTHKDTQDTHGTTYSADWLYDLIMGELEPDLTTDNLPLLEEKYENEPEEGRLEREQRYEEAFEIFDRILEDIDDELLSGMRKKKTAARKKISKKEKEERSEEMGTTEEQLDTYLSSDL